MMFVKRIPALLCATLLAVCYMGLVACGDSNAQGQTEAPGDVVDQPEESTLDSESDDESSHAKKYLGVWQTAGYVADGITITGDLDSALGSGLDMVLSIEQNGKGTFSYMAEDYPVDWSATDDTLSIATATEVAGGDILLGFRNGSYDETDYIAIDFSYDNDSLLLPLSDSEQVILAKDGTIEDMPAVSVGDLEPITSADGVLGTWQIRGVAMGDTTFYGSGANLFQAIGLDIEDDEAASLTFGEDGTATFLGGNLEWRIEDDKLVLADPEMQIPVASLGDDIAVDVSRLSDSPMVMVFSK